MVWRRRLTMLAAFAALLILTLAPLGGCKKEEEPSVTPGTETDDSGAGSGMVKGQITKDQVDAAKEKAKSYSPPAGG